MKRIHRKLFRLNDQIDHLRKEAAGVNAELEYHRAINEDAQRDASVGNYIDREEAGLTSGDVRRFERTLSDIDVRIERLSAKRDRLLAKLED